MKLLNREWLFFYSSIVVLVVALNWSSIQYGVDLWLRNQKVYTLYSDSGISSLIDSKLLEEERQLVLVYSKLSLGCPGFLFLKKLGGLSNVRSLVFVPFKYTPEEIDTVKFFSGAECDFVVLSESQSADLEAYAAETGDYVYLLYENGTLFGAGVLVESEFDHLVEFLTQEISL